MFFSFQKQVFRLGLPISCVMFVDASISTKIIWLNTSGVNVEWNLSSCASCVLTEPSKRATLNPTMEIDTRTSSYNSRQIIQTLKDHFCRLFDILGKAVDWKYIIQLKFCLVLNIVTLFFIDNCFMKICYVFLKNVINSFHLTINYIIHVLIWLFFLSDVNLVLDLLTSYVLLNLYYKKIYCCFIWLFL